MNKKQVGLTTLFILLLSVFSVIAWAQGDGYKETFDDSTLPNWERAREVIVTNGVLKMTPGSFALRFGDWSEITLTVRLRYSGAGEIAINYYFRDQGKYALILHDSHLNLDKEQNRTPTSLGDANVSAVQPNAWITVKVIVVGGQHQVYINDELALTATDPDPIETGAVLLQAMGEATVEFDDLEVRGTPGGGPPVPEREIQPPVDQPVAALQPTPTAVPGPVSTKSLIDEFFTGQASNLELATLAINLVLAALCAYILSLVYIHWGSSLSNRRRFAANFMLMTVTTAFIILVVRSSVALSLGLVGALSIVRFRTAVKEPEELAYLFFAIGLGIGLGDNQRLITLLSLAVGIVVIGLYRLFRRTQADVNLHLTVTSHSPRKIGLDQITQALKAHTARLKLLRFDETAETLETDFLVEFRKLASLNDARAALQALSETVEISFLDNKGIW
ncbi:MAG: DUF4956 domain-containing protein [Anaerolineae bacterium]|nr:DUF4956 domain-containing protein [Anaerolineae bacterium]